MYNILKIFFLIAILHAYFFYLKSEPANSSGSELSLMLSLGITYCNCTPHQYKKGECLSTNPTVYNR